jgi:cytochrome P450
VRWVESIDDYLTGPLAAKVAGRPVADDEVARALPTFAIARHETTMNAVNSLLWVLALDRDLQTRPDCAPIRRWHLCASGAARASCQRMYELKLSYSAANCV